MGKIVTIIISIAALALVVGAINTDQVMGKANEAAALVIGG